LCGVNKQRARKTLSTETAWRFDLILSVSPPNAKPKATHAVEYEEAHISPSSGPCEHVYMFTSLKYLGLASSWLRADCSPHSPPKLHHGIVKPDMFKVGAIPYD